MKMQSTDAKKAAGRLSPVTLAIAGAVGLILLPLTLVALWKAGATPFEYFAVPLLLGTALISLWMSIHWREWRALPLALVIGLVTVRQGLSLAARQAPGPGTQVAGVAAEVLLWSVLPLAFVAVAFLWRIFENQARFRVAQIALSESEAKHRYVIENSTDALYTADAEGNFTLVNPGTARLFGRRTGDLLGSSVFDLVPEAARQDMRQALSRQLGGDVSAFYHEFPVTRRDGKTCWVGQNIKVSARQGELLGFNAMLRDITERRQAEDALRASETRLRTLFATMWEGIMQSDQDGDIVFANPAAQKLIGASQEELQKRNVRDRGWGFLDENEAARAPRDWAGCKALHEKHPVHGDVIGLHQDDGSVRWLNANAVPIVNSEGQPAGVVITLTDITKARETEDNVRIVEFGLDHAGENVFLLNQEGRIIYSNQNASESLDYTTAELSALSIFDIDRQLTREDWAELVRVAKEGEWPTSESVHMAKDGRTFPALVSSNYFEFKGEGYIFSFVHDVSREAELSSQLRQSQKMEAIGTLAGGIAHDFNNILGAILGYTELSQQQVPKGDKLGTYLQEVHAAANRAADLVAQILTFSRRREHVQQPTQLAPVVKETLKLLRGSLPSTIDISQHIDADCDPVMADAAQIHQVVMNLCTNAYQAMREKGGTLTLTLDEVELGTESSSDYLNLKPGRYVKLSVSDTGVGMDEETRQRMFEPFFTSKAEGEGTGLGLATVHGIVKSHHGYTHVDSSPGSGTRLDIVLPICVGAGAVAEAEKAPEGDIPGGDERVLIIDDEAQIAGSARIAMEMLGYRVTSCDNALEAISLFQGHPDAFDIVVTDQTMPGMTGLELAEKIHTVSPDMPIVMCTGLKGAISDADIERAGLSIVLRKPVGVNKLGRIVRDVLDGVPLAA